MQIQLKLENNSTIELTEKSPRVNVVGLEVNLCDYDSAMRRVHELANARGGGYICLATVHMTMEGQDDRDFQRLVNNADLVVPDGKPLSVMQKLLGNENARQVRGPGLMPKLFAYAEQNNLSVGFYGGKQETLDRLLERLAIEFPRLKVAYSFSPPFRPVSAEEDREIVSAINRSGVQILFVGLGCPKQERWMAQHREKLTSVMLGVGAAFDFYTETITEAPVWMQRIGLEWMFRLVQEPRRLWRRYLILNPRFTALAVLQLAGVKKFENEKSKT